MRTRLVLAALLGLGLGAVVPAAAAGRFAEPGDRDLTLTVGGRARTYLVHLPPRFRERAPLPILLAFHGGGGTAAGFKAYSGLDAVADREGFVVVYPDGSGRPGRRLLTWNAGDCCGFALALLADLATDLPLDRRRVYATGHSNGAMMAYRVALEAAARIAAIAPVAGMMVADPFAPAAPVPVLHIHSVDDPRALYAGGLGPAFPFTRIRVAHRPVEAGLARWIARAGCPVAGQVVETRATPPDARGRRHTAIRWRWGPCASAAEVELWKLTGAGHGWPGGPSPLPEGVMGPDTTVISAAEEVWRFVRRFRRP